MTLYIIPFYPNADTPEVPPASSADTTGQGPSCVRTSNDHAANALASPPGTSVPVTPTASQQLGQQSRVDVTQCRTSSIQSEPAPTVTFFTTTDPGTSSWKKVIDLDAASSEESEEEEEKDGYTAYGEVETVHSEDKNDPEPTTAPTQPRSFKDSSDEGGSTQLTSDGSNTHAHVLGSPVSMASFGKNEVCTRKFDSEMYGSHRIFRAAAPNNPAAQSPYLTASPAPTSCI